MLLSPSNFRFSLIFTINSGSSGFSTENKVKEFLEFLKWFLVEDRRKKNLNIFKNSVFTINSNALKKRLGGEKVNFVEIYDWQLKFKAPIKLTTKD